MGNLIHKFKTSVYFLVSFLRSQILKRKGWVMAQNVQISLRGVKKIGGVKSIVTTMYVLMLKRC